MLSMQRKLAKRLVKVRERLELSQRGVAARCGFSQSYLAQVERGVRPISERALARLELAYETSFGKLWAGVGRRGRPAYAAQTRRALRRFGRGIREFWGRGLVAIPEHAQPQEVLRSEDPLCPIALHLGEAAGREVKALERLRQEDEQFWRQFNRLRFDSWSEKRLQVRVGLLGGQLLGLRLDRLRCGFSLVDGETGEKAGLHRGYVLAGQEASVVWCPQVAVATSRRILCLDDLLLVSDGRKTVTVGVEVDGAEYHRDADKECRRDRALGIPVLHVGADELNHRGS